MTASAIYGFIGVLLGSATTAVLKVYRELVTSRREREARERQRMQDRQDQRDAFQRASLLLCKMRCPILSRPCSTSRTGCLRTCSRPVVGLLGSGRRQPRLDGRTPSCGCRSRAPECSTKSCETLLVRYTRWRRRLCGRAVLMKQKILTCRLSRDTSVSMIWLPKRSQNSTEIW
jgi:hypothetical protein